MAHIVNGLNSWLLSLGWKQRKAERDKQWEQVSVSWTNRRLW